MSTNTPTDDHSDHARCGECAEWPRTPTDDERVLCGDWPAPCNCDDPETHDGAVHRTVQDEPSDAAVLAALNARELSVRERSGSARHFNPAPDLSYYSDGNVQDMRAALRAAAEAGGER